MGQDPTPPYVHTLDMHNLDSPSRLVPPIYDVLEPRKVVDVGCGIGTFLKVFKDLGAEVLGLDGPWVDRELMSENLEPHEFRTTDLNRPFDVPEVFDLALCLEVAEHLEPESASPLVGSLTRLAPVVLFSAAIPEQGGQNHVNEQWPSYWIARFEAEGFECHDVVRPMIWNDEAIQPWYRQNAMLFVRRGYSLPADALERLGGSLFDVVHPHYHLYRSRLLDDILQGRYGLPGYLGLILEWAKQTPPGRLARRLRKELFPPSR